MEEEFKTNDIGKTRLPEEICSILQSNHMMHQNNKEPHSHVGGIRIVVNKKIKHLIRKIVAISERVIYLILRISKNTISWSFKESCAV